ncbi:DUF58 domain-containing protein [Nitratiruptor tergarcus]|uniref:Uncharacterized conserved protein (Some members contain a von Willebrand factor type A (VWA) domain) n=1 Tax=Nitratiruptor tergarcus DSM 16512 TaxID=1069081 RepID=A0A1W1WRX7_9BACT|nr:DUF58 domain-containing protein [Nitratiruptor tergarcus]SMC09078.1 Uncharacterized conserved protein (some members contain a von Willebrand factor type A (vWA) domain) [Nitratiruptor tergarcus DSM 16512]
MTQKNIKKLLIKAKKQVFSEIPGNNPSLFKGEGFDFVELREYQPGDDVKKIDWLVTAKLQKPYIKLYREERELNVVVAFMLNGSMFFGTKRFKQELAAEIGAILGFAAIKNQDNFSYILFADKEYSSIRPTKHINAVQKCAESVAKFVTLGKSANFSQLTQRLFKIRRKSIVFIISDFFGEYDFKVLAKKHEVVAIVVRDRFEEDPTPIGFMNLIDPETKKSFIVDFEGSTLKNYKKEIKKADSKMYEHFKQSGVRFTKIYTHEEPFIKLLKLFGQK